MRNSLVSGLFVLMGLSAAGVSPLCAQQVTQYQVPQVGVAFTGLGGITAGPDGAMWFGGGYHVGRITTAGVVTQYPLPTGNSVSNFITPGPDGALWFTETFVNSTANPFSKIGRITTAGVITEFPLPDPLSLPYAITAGPDGALWFAEAGSGKIGRITTSGTITEYPVMNGGGYVLGMTVGPDSAIWFPGNDVIARITTSGAVTEYPLPISIPPYPTGITAGPDGALWFAAGRGIGRITTSGATTYYPVSNPQSATYDIATGPDGALWFTEQGTGQIGRITPSGTITEYATWGITPGFLNNIAAGPDGAMWFTVLGGQIGRIATSANPPPPPPPVIPQSGWWWDPNLSGEGFFIEYGGQSGSGLFMAGFFSDASGNPTWLVSLGPMNGSTYAGTWLKASGGQALLGPYRSPTLAGAGAVSIAFSDPSHGVLTRPDGSTVNIQRYPFYGSGAVATPEAGTPEVGWWWGGTALSGTGYAIEFQGANVFVAGYVYDATGDPVWDLAIGSLTSPTQYTGTWDSYAGGPQLTSPEGTYPSHKTGSPSPLVLNFTDSTHGTMTMGTVSIPIIRYRSF